MDCDMIQELFDNDHFILLLRDQVQHLVGQTVVRRNQTKSCGNLVDEINTYIGKIIELNSHQEMTNITQNINQTLLGIRQQGQKQIQITFKVIQQENQYFKRNIEDSLKHIKQDMMSNSIRIDQKINRSSMLPIPKLQDITNLLNQSQPKSMKILNILPFSSKQLPQLDSTCSDQLKERLKQFQKTIGEIESVLLDLQNRLHERYQTNITSLWKVVAEIQGKILTQQKVESKLDDFRGSILFDQNGIGSKVQKSKKWFKF